MKKDIQTVAVIVNGTISDYEWTRKALLACDYIIAVDGGGNHLQTMDLFPDLVVGDLDSLEHSTREAFEHNGCPFMTFPSAKDQSDLQLALEHAASLQPQKIRLLGALGKRFDHTYGNVLLLSLMADQGTATVIEDETHEIQVITSAATFTDMAGSTLSLFSLTPETRGIATQGMAYPLCREPLYLGDTRGLSNIIKDPEAAVSIASGKLLAVRVKTVSSDQ